VRTPRDLLAQSLKQARLDAGLLQDELARRLSTNQARVSRTEAGRRTPDLDEVRAWLDVLRPPADKRERILYLAEQAGTDITEWTELQQVGWDRHQRRYEDLEAEATSVALYQNSLIPGPLQTSRYVQHLMGQVLGVAASQIPDAVTGRLRRQEMLTLTGRHLDVVITQSVLEQPFGSPDLMAEQLDRLAALARLPAVNLGVLPTNTAMREVWRHEFTLYDMPESDESEVLVELLTGEVRVNEPAKVDQYRELFKLYQRNAVTGAKAIKLVTQIGKAMRRNS
jgi:transcriptional regulator with XRE-family HTH domain